MYQIVLTTANHFIREASTIAQVSLVQNYYHPRLKVMSMSMKMSSMRRQTLGQRLGSGKLWKQK